MKSKYRRARELLNCAPFVWITKQVGQYIFFFHRIAKHLLYEFIVMFVHHGRSLQEGTKMCGARWIFVGIRFKKGCHDGSREGCSESDIPPSWRLANSAHVLGSRHVKMLVTKGRAVHMGHGPQVQDRAASIYQGGQCGGSPDPLGATDAYRKRILFGWVFRQT